MMMAHRECRNTCVGCV